MTPDVAAALSPLASCLRGGGIALLFVAVDGGVVAARGALRPLCSDLLAALAARHRLLPRASRSATPGLGAIALSASAAIGVDVERLRPALVDDDLLELVLHADERAAAGADADDDAFFFDRWTRKEAVMKALGVGLALAPASFDAGPATAGWHLLQTGCGAARVRRVEHPGTRGFAAALAIAGAGGAAADTTAEAPADVRTFWLDAQAPAPRRPLGSPRLPIPAGGSAAEPACGSALISPAVTRSVTRSNRRTERLPPAA